MLQIYVDQALSKPELSRPYSLEEIISMIQQPPTPDLIQAREAGKGSEVYDSVKKHKRNAIRWGFQTYKEITNETPATGLIYLDIDSDELGEMSAKEAKELIIQIPWVLAVWVSFGGKGIGFIACAEVQNTQHYKDLYFAMSAEILALTGLLCDEACADASRRCVMSSDPELLINQSPVWFDSPVRVKKHYDSENSIFKQFNRSVEARDLCVQILEQKGWVHVGKMRYRRPGKSGNAVSAVVNTNLEGRNPHSVHIFTSSTDIEPGHYDFCQFICDTQYQGDKTAFTKYLYQLLGQNTSSKGQTTSLPKLNFSPAALKESTDKLDRIVDQLSLKKTENPLQPINWSEINPAFGSMCRELSSATGFFVEFYASAALYGISTATCGKVIMKVSEGYNLRPNFWSINIAAPGDAKSPPSKHMTKVFFDFQRALNDRYDTELAEYNAQMEMYSEMSKKEKDLTGMTKPNAIPPKKPLFLFTSGTVEGLISSLSHNKIETATGFYDEFMMFFKNLNAYKGGKGGDKETILSLYGCEPISKVLVEKSIFVESPFVPLHGTAVENTILNFFRTDDNSNNGLYERFCLTFPVEKKERDHIARVNRVMAPAHSYNAMVNNMLNYFYNLQSEVLIQYPEWMNSHIDAIEIQFSNARNMYKAAKIPSMASLFAKIETTFHKIVPLFWAFRNFYYSPVPIDFFISWEDVQGAMSIINYYIGTQTYVHDKIFNGVDYTELDNKGLSDYKEGLVKQILQIEPNVTGKECETILERLTPSSKKVSYSTICRWIKENK